MPQAVVNRLRALREPEETFNDVILRLRTTVPERPSRNRRRTRDRILEDQTSTVPDLEAVNRALAAESE
jgi:hypothetical protein